MKSSSRPPDPQPGQEPDKHQDRDTGPEQNPGSKDLSRRTGQWMIIGFWVLLLGLAYLWASRHLDFMSNPNPVPNTSIQAGRTRVELAINRYGHYVTSGTINGSAVTFLLDTGATSVSVPAALAERLKLTRGRPIQLSTANGIVTGFAVTLDSVAIGNLARTHVQAHINPGLSDGEVLLGMSYLRHFQLKQNRDSLTIEEYP